jgi:His/Glu/Gln/Arg/opine family amino acid ABC transporter permease subunit
MSFDLDLLVQWLPRLFRGLWVTLQLFAVIMIISTPLALLVALGRTSQNRRVRTAAAVYVNVVRALPILVVLFFTFYGLPALGYSVQPFTAAVCGMVFCTTAYLSDDLRAGLMAVPAGQYEAADALGISRARFVRRILLPQALPVMCGPFFTRAIVTVKATSIASIVAVSELTAQSMAALTETYRATEFLTFAAACYLICSLVLALLQAATQRLVAIR